MQQRDAAGLASVLNFMHNPLLQFEASTEDSLN
jgi:hypothetical protein